MTYEIELPLPPKACSPNKRGHWAKNSGAVRDYRFWCRWAYQEAQYKYGWPKEFKTPVTIHLDFYLCRDSLIAQLDEDLYFPRDDDNARGCFKAAQDALKDAGLIPDDSSKYVKLGTTRRLSTKKQHGGMTCIIARFEESL